MTDAVITEETEGTPELHTWLTERVAFYLEKPVDDIDPELPLAEYGLGSVYAVSVCGDIEDTFGLDVEPTLVWDYPTIDAIAEYISGRLAGEDGTGAVAGR